jgi:hypothetical protein
MKIEKIGLQVDGVFLFVLVAIAGSIYFYFTKQNAVNAVKEGLNPVSPNNIVNKTAQAIVGKDRLQGGFNGLFAVVDIINPFNDNDAYAKKVLGMDNNQANYLP